MRSDTSLHSWHHDGGGIDKYLVAKKTPFFFTIEIGHETAAEASSDFAKNESLVWRRRQGAGISSAEATG